MRMTCEHCGQDTEDHAMNMAIEAFIRAAQAMTHAAEVLSRPKVGRVIRDESGKIIGSEQA